MRDIDLNYNVQDVIEKSELNDFLIWAKSYNIFQISKSKQYENTCTMIKARLDREGLSHETVRPE